MSSQVQGYIVLADITGYTSYIAKTELEHSQAIVGEILHLVISQLTPTLDLAEIEGDAVFAYAPSHRFARSETLIEVIETTYLQFRNRRESMKMLTSCSCKACASMPTLDLKFIAHAGTFVMQTVAGKQKPVGPDVILAHRLLKNNVAASTGWGAYILFTDRALSELNIGSEGMHHEIEKHEHFGQVPTYSVDLNRRYRELSATKRVTLSTDEVHGKYVIDFPVAPAVVWDWLCSPEKRTLYTGGGVHWTAGRRLKGRSGVGASNHCEHGNETSTETVIDWKPFEYLAAEYTGTPVPIIMTHELIQIEKGTRLLWQICFKMALPAWLCKPIGAILNKVFVKMDKTFLKMRELIEAEVKPAEMEYAP